MSKSAGNKSRSRRAAASAVSMRWHRARVTAVRADGRVTESRHGTTADAVSHAVALAVQSQSNGRGRAYKECRVHGRVSTRLVGSELVVWRVSKRDLSPIVDSIRSRAAARFSGAYTGPSFAPVVSRHDAVAAPALRSESERSEWLAANGVTVRPVVPDEVLLAVPGRSDVRPHMPGSRAGGRWQLRHDVPPFGALP